MLLPFPLCRVNCSKKSNETASRGFNRQDRTLLFPGLIGYLFQSCVFYSDFSMRPFLYSVARRFYSEYEADLYRYTFVFPNRRAGVFFQKYLAEIAGKTLFFPSILTIEELFESLSDYRIADRIEMLVLLYGCYTDIGGTIETFDDFLYWGEMLLNDFNDVDKHLTDARQIFKNISDLHSLDRDASYLTPEQIEAIRRFWMNFMPIENNSTKKKFQETWQILFEVYTAFRAALHEKGHAYEGMLFRQVAEKARAKEALNLRFSNIVFVGLNVLTPAEAALLEYLKNLGVADFYWDYDSPQVRDPQNRASYRISENLRRFPSNFMLHDSMQMQTVDPQRDRPKIEVIGIPSGVGQAKHVTHILAQLIESGEIPDPDQALSTAVVLPDENLLLPLLYSIPEEIGKINVTMGYKLSYASVASLVEHLAGLQRNVRMSAGETVFYYRFVLSVLNHPLVARATQGEVEELKTHILKNNRVVVSVQELSKHRLLELIFVPLFHWRDVAGYLKSILSHLFDTLTEAKHRDGGGAPDHVRPIDLEREFIVRYYRTVVRLQDTVDPRQEMSVETFFRLLKRLVQGVSVPFSGEPLSGLQIMGVLETRVLDFDNLILLSMNEGVFPLKNPVNSFIPYTLRKGFGLPTHEHRDATYAYHFYRMISRARRVFMLYDTRTEEMQTGEVSRYFYQLKYLYAHAFDIQERVLAHEVWVPETVPVSIAKTADVMRKLNRFRVGGDASLSASLVNNYINCPLQFYFAAVEGISEETEVQESVEADVFGSIFHRLMETIYNRLKNVSVTADALSAVIADEAYLTGLIEKGFARYYFKDDANPRPLQGQHYLIGEILRSYVKQTLQADKQFVPFRYIASEHRFDCSYRVNDTLEVNFKGSIDRIDEVGETCRIIDYKTGSGAADFKDIQQLFDSSKNNRPYQILQVFLYALFYGLENPTVRLSPAIYYLRFIFKNFDPSISCQHNRIDDIAPYMPEFIERFHTVLEEIFDPSVPFLQTSNRKNCEWCPFKEICGRGVSR